MLASYHGFDDLDLARKLQEEYDREALAQLASESESSSGSRNGSLDAFSTRSPSLSLGVSPVDPSLEVTDPNPEIRELFIQFNDQFFWGSLSGIEVKWSPRMTLCAGLCVYEGHGGLCSVRLSLPLLKLRPRKDLVETLLHEMIHAYLFVTDHDRDHDDHGPNFKKHMHRINKETGANISIYHTFHDEVAAYQQHWWKCDGPCQKRPPYYGMVKRAMNRPPSQRDPWFGQHQATCGGTFVKVKEPEGYGQKKGGKGKGEKSGKSSVNKSSDIRAFVGKGSTLGSSQSAPDSKHSDSGDHSQATSSGRGDVPGQGRGLAVITNGVLTHRKNPGGDTDQGSSGPGQPQKKPSLLFSSVSLNSSTSSSGTKAGGVGSTSRTTQNDSGHSRSSGTARTNRPSPSPSGRSSGKAVNRSKGNFNDNITLIELFRRRQAKEKAKEEGGGKGSRGKPDGKFASIGKSTESERVAKKSTNKSADSVGKIKTEIGQGFGQDDGDDFVDLTDPDEMTTHEASLSSTPKTKTLSKKPVKTEIDEGFGQEDDDDFVDLTNPDEMNTHGASLSSSPKPKTPPSKKRVNTTDVKPRWKNIFPTMSGGKKHRDRHKGAKGLKDRFSRDFVSVCEGGDYDDVKSKPSGSKKKKGAGTKAICKYVFDDLDSNDDLWSEGGEPPGASGGSDRESVGRKAASSESDQSDRFNQNSWNKQNDSSKSTDSREALDNVDRSVAGPSGSKPDGHRLGKGETGLSFLAQVRRKLQEQQRQGQGRLNPDTDGFDSSMRNSSNKRSSGAAFGHGDSLPEAKRYSVRVEEEESEEQHVVSGEDAAAAAPAMVPCPACTQLVPEADINDHLDRCLL